LDHKYYFDDLNKRNFSIIHPSPQTANAMGEHRMATRCLRLLAITQVQNLRGGSTYPPTLPSPTRGGGKGFGNAQLKKKYVFIPGRIDRSSFCGSKILS
jgi:hypothetical protein